MATLIVISRKDQGRFWPLGHRTNVVGRDEGLLVQILDPHVSRKHLRIRFDKERSQYVAEDMASRHGVFVNGQRLKSDLVLNDNDCIDIGGTTLLFTLKDFSDSEGALAHFRTVGERLRGTLTDGPGRPGGRG